MKTIFTIIFISLQVAVFGYNWTITGLSGVHAQDIVFNIGTNDNTIICTDNGMCIDNGPGNSWVIANYGLPVLEAVDYTFNRILLVMGNGTYSDGIYEFDLTTNTYKVVTWCYFPTFIKYNPVNGNYYVGTRYDGLLSSTDGMDWDTIPWFQGKGCTAMDFYGQHLVISQETNICETYYSDDNGQNWNISASNLAIHDLQFDLTGVLYGVVSGTSNSSGIYLSHDYGQTWKKEAYVFNLNTVGFDVMDVLFTGFHGSVGNSQGVAIYDTATNNFSYLNNGLPNTYVHKIRMNPVLSSITIFACTNDGVYFCNNYNASIEDFGDEEQAVNIYPNPAHDFVVIESKVNSVAGLFNINGQLVQSVILTETKTTMDISGLPGGLYIVKAMNDDGITQKKLIKQ